MKVEKFSKSSDAVISNKQSFFEKNEDHLNYVRQVNDLYLKQPKRLLCKTCNSELQDAQLVIHGVPYTICQTCNHFNGLHEDTIEFANFVYNSSDGSSYAKNYKNDYLKRVSDIYLPKVSFLKEVLENDSCSQGYSLMDMGCGGGHFVKACEQMGIKATGFDTNKQLIELGNSMLDSNEIIFNDLGEINNLIETSDADILSLIGVLEHVMDPISVLDSFSRNNSTYLYLQVPLFSLSALMESIHSDVFPRQLNAGHTHLYTENSINYLCDYFNFEIIGEWWFGTDMVDFFRHLYVKLDVEQDTKRDLLNKLFMQSLDELQNVLDKKKVCSGVNMVIKKGS